MDLKEFQSKGGKARAKKYSKEQLSKWSKLGGRKGGRPRKITLSEAEL